MIKNYTGHAANERTFLAWVGTAIVVMAFGFLCKGGANPSHRPPNFAGRRSRKAATPSL